MTAATAGAELLQIRSLNQFYGSSHTLWDVSMSVPTGSCTCLMGRNGMGKTTTIRAIMGMLPALGGRVQAGRIGWQGASILGQPAHVIARPDDAIEGVLPKEAARAPRK